MFQTTDAKSKGAQHKVSPEPIGRNLAPFSTATKYLEMSEADQLSQSPVSIALVALVPGPQQATCVRWLRERYISGIDLNYCYSWQDTYVCAYATALAMRLAGHVDLSDGLIAALKVNRNDSPLTETHTFGGLIDTLDRYAGHQFDLKVTHTAAVENARHGEERKWGALLQWPEFFNAELSVAGYCGECLYGMNVDLDRYVQAFGLPNGSISNSPSASAITVLNHLYWGKPVPAKLAKYVSELDPYKRTVGILDQVTHFVTAWMLMYLATWQNKLIETQHVESLRKDLSRAPLVCSSEASTFPGELDTGSVAMIGLNWPMAERQRMIESVSAMMFDGRSYRTFLFERNASISTNIHILAAWPDNPRRDLVLGWLAEELSAPCNQWICKWHVSPYYVLSEIGRLLINFSNPVAQALVRRAGDYLLKTQQADGGWGIRSSTTEETAYVALALDTMTHYDGWRGKRVEQAIERARIFLHRPPDYVPLWIGKCLYCVRPLVRGLQQAALYRIESSKSQTRPLSMLE